VLCCRVRGVAQYATFTKMLHAQGTQRVLPGMAQDVVDGTRIYHEMCNRTGVSYRELEKSCGVVAILLEALGQSECGR
jgi:ASC-1-like (ASCH) protein